MNYVRFCWPPVSMTAWKWNKQMIALCATTERTWMWAQHIVRKQLPDMWTRKWYHNYLLIGWSQSRTRDKWNEHVTGANVQCIGRVCDVCAVCATRLGDVSMLICTCGVKRWFIVSWRECHRLNRAAGLESIFERRWVEWNTKNWFSARSHRVSLIIIIQYFLFVLNFNEIGSRS